MFEIPGKRTVPRAELFASTVAAKAINMRNDKSGTTKVDAAYVVSCAKNEENYACVSMGNRDIRTLYSSARQQVKQVVSKVKSHNESKLLQGELDLIDYLGNLLADIGAGVVAEAQVSGLQGTDEEKWDAVAYSIARMLAEIEAQKWEKTPQQVPLEQRDPKAVPTLTAEEAEQEVMMAHRTQDKESQFVQDGAIHILQEMQDEETRS